MERTCRKCGETKGLELFVGSSGGACSACETALHMARFLLIMLVPDMASAATWRQILGTSMCKIASRRKRNPDNAKARGYAYRQNNKERIIAQRAAYYQRNKERIKAAGIAYYRNNKGRLRARNAAYYQENKKRLKAITAAYYQNNKEQAKAYTAVYRAKKRGARIGDRKDVVAFYKYVQNADRLKCHWCGRLTTKTNGPRKRNVDHIKPIAKEGPEDVHNLCVSCAHCNHHKSAKLPHEFTGQYELELA